MQKFHEPMQLKDPHPRSWIHDQEKLSCTANVWRVFLNTLSILWQVSNWHPNYDATCKSHRKLVWSLDPRSFFEIHENDGTIVRWQTFHKNPFDDGTNDDCK
jgi:hypothetical protein